MNSISRFLTVVTVLFSALFVARFASAQAPVAPEAPTTLHADVEVDPTAYVLNGYSLHVGFGYRRLRVDLGCFAMDVPQFVHGNKGFEASFNGYGVKLQYFLFAEQRGLFVGADVGLSRLYVEREHTELAASLSQISTGVNAGYRFMLPANFYVTAWLGVSHSVGAHDVTLGGRTFENSSVMIFPALHLGYRFL